jgi:hypothetical protein
MKLESYRNNKTGALTVCGKDFTLVIEPDGHVKAIGLVTIDRDIPSMVGPAKLAGNVYAPDAPSARGVKAPGRRRGSR